MLATALQVLLAVCTLLGRLASLVSQQRQRQAGADSVTAATLKEQAARAEIARRARRDAAAAGVPERDPYRRD